MRQKRLKGKFMCPSIRPKEPGTEGGLVCLQQANKGVGSGQVGWGRARLEGLGGDDDDDEEVEGEL